MSLYVVICDLVLPVLTLLPATYLYLTRLVVILCHQDTAKCYHIVARHYIMLQDDAKISRCDELLPGMRICCHL